MDPSLFFSSLAAPIVVGIGVGWISNRWSSSHGWLQAEVESRSNYYAEVLVAGQELREALPHMYEHAALLRDFEDSGHDDEPDTAFLEGAREIDELAERTVATWRRQVRKAPIYSAAVVATPIKASDDALDRMLGAFHQIDPLPTLQLRCQIVQLWMQAVESTIERDMVDLRLSAIRGLPWRQRRAERLHLRETSSVLEAEITEKIQEISSIVDKLEVIESSGDVNV